MSCSNVQRFPQALPNILNKVNHDAPLEGFIFKLLNVIKYFAIIALCTYCVLFNAVFCWVNKNDYKKTEVIIAKYQFQLYVLYYFYW